MPARIQNRSDLYAETTIALPAEGIQEAELVGVEVLATTFGERVGLVFRLGNGTEVMQSAAPGSPRGKLAELLHAVSYTHLTLPTSDLV